MQNTDNQKSPSTLHDAKKNKISENFGFGLLVFGLMGFKLVVFGLMGFGKMGFGLMGFGKMGFGLMGFGKWVSD